MMRSSADTNTKTYLLLALLAALAVLLRLGENLLPLPMQLGGARPGLANTLTIICLYLFGLRLTGLFLTVRVLLVGLLSTGLLTPGFLIAWRHPFEPVANGTGTAQSGLFSLRHRRAGCGCP